MTRATALLATLVAAGGGGFGTIDLTGRVGRVRLGRSDARAIVAFAGRPDARGRGHGFRSIGYGCTPRERDGAFWVQPRGPYCDTVFFLSTRTGKLGDVFTASRGYRGPHDVRVGMTTATAERLLHARVYVGCEENIYRGSKTTAVTIAFAGGRRASNGHLVGGHVSALVAHDVRNGTGVFDCL